MEAAERVVVHCKSCGESIAAEDVHLENLVARCGACDAVFSIREHVHPEGQSRLSAARRADSVDDGNSTENWLEMDDGDDGALPPGISFVDDGWKLSVRKRWFAARHVSLFFFSLVWCGVIGFAYASFAADGEVDLVAYLVPAFHAAVGLGLLYGALAGFVNSTRVEVDDRTLRVRQGPLPWRGNFLLPRSDIEQIYCRPFIWYSRAMKSRRDALTGLRSVRRPARRYRTYEVAVKCSDGQVRPLVTGLSRAEQGVAIERQLEERLRLADRPVEGEAPRGS